MNPALPLPAANSASSEDALNALVLREQVASLFATIRISSEEVPRFLPPRDGANLTTRFRAALGVAPS